MAIPFAFAIGHLLSGQIGDEWVETARRWALVVWAILTTGLLLGSWWAYTILGWGGYWGWDPIENVGLEDSDNTGNFDPMPACSPISNQL